MDDTLNEELPQIIGDYKYYRIFNGTLQVENKFSLCKTLEKVQLLTCSRAQIIGRCAQIKDNMILNTRLSRKMFEEYMEDRIFGDQSKNNYIVVPGWLQGSRDLHQLKSQMRQSDS